MSSFVVFKRSRVMAGRASGRTERAARRWIPIQLPGICRGSGGPLRREPAYGGRKLRNLRDESPYRRAMSPKPTGITVSRAVIAGALIIPVQQEGSGVLSLTWNGVRQMPADGDLGM